MSPQTVIDLNLWLSHTQIENQLRLQLDSFLEKYHQQIFSGQRTFQPSYCQSEPSQKDSCILGSFLIFYYIFKHEAQRFSQQAKFNYCFYRKKKNISEESIKTINRSSLQNAFWGFSKRVLFNSKYGQKSMIKTCIIFEHPIMNPTLSQINDEKDKNSESGKSNGSSLRVPESLKSGIQQNADGFNPKKTSDIPTYNSIKKATGLFFLCEICELEYRVQERRQLGKCQHYFCGSCLEKYTLYKVGLVQPILCPKENCRETLQQDSQFYSQLPIFVQNQLKRNSTYFKIKQNPDLHLCPNINCNEGVVKLRDEKLFCEKCKKEFCPDCHQIYHGKDCTAKETKFLEQNFRYKQCYNCKNMIEKSQGCCHIKCRCGNQFCYICGCKWESGHFCLGVQNRFLQFQNVNNDGIGREGSFFTRICHIFHSTEREQPIFECLQAIRGESVGSKILSVLMKVFILSFLWILVSSIILTFILVVNAGGFAFSLAMGVPYTIIYLLNEKQKQPTSILCLLIIFFPITIVISMAKTIKQAFEGCLCQITTYALQQYFKFCRKTFCW